MLFTGRAILTPMLFYFYRVKLRFFSKLGLINKKNQPKGCINIMVKSFSLSMCKLKIFMYICIVLISKHYFLSESGDKQVEI
jgi:hypothetical protein